ncbi:SDR family oxidoreductase [Nonomuraea sp. NPDC050556]|uniref:SDR family oxidoreductase n=1 Tax=Nonomuraea sp. NPDC050556 TaxID=3364369 RepID=UPI00379BFE4D
MTEKKTALVTGANKGIGYEIVAQLTALGMTVLLGSRDPQRGADAAKALGVEPVTIDVTDPKSVAAAAAFVESRYGRLDVLVNNAGIAGGWGQLPSSADLDEVRAVFETNVFSVITVTNAMLPLLSRSPAARIVNLSSGVGSLAMMSDPDGQLAELPASAAYVPSKTALNALTLQYAKELAKTGILVNAADPGYCATDLNGHRGFRSAAQGAAIAVHLATLDADGPTGGYFNDDGPVPW